MRARLSVLACALTLIPVTASAQTILTDAVTIVTDVGTLGREVRADGAPFEVKVVFLNPTYGFGSVGAAQFGIDLDPGLTLVAATSDGIVLEQAPREYVIAYPDCQAETGGDPFVLMSLTVSREAGAAPGAGVRITDLPTMGEPLRATRCSSHELFFPINYGGVVVNPAEPEIAALVASPALPVEGRDYEVAWETVGAGNWLLDGSPVPARGSMTYVATSDRMHLLELESGTTQRAIDVEVIREPRLVYFEQVPSENPSEVRVYWNFVGTDLTNLSGVGWVPAQGSRLVDISEIPVIELSASNEWGSTWRSVELVPPASPPVIEEFSFNPEIYGFGQTIQLVYDVIGATEVTIEPEFGRVPIGSNALAFVPLSQQTWHIRASNSLGITTAEFTTPSAPPDIRYITLDPDNFDPGDEAEISYSVVGADSAWFEPGELLPLPAGTLNHIVTDSIETWVLTAINAGGQVSQEIRIAPDLPYLWMDATREFTYGEPVTIAWDVRYASELTLYPGPISLSPVDGYHKLEIIPDSTTVYTLVASNLGGKVSESRTVVEILPSIQEFSVEPSGGFVGDEVVFSWAAHGAREVRIVDRDGPVSGLTQPPVPAPSSGSVTHVFDERYSERVQLVAVDSLGAEARSPEISLKIIPETTFITSFYAETPEFQEPGGTTVLVWEVATDGAGVTFDLQSRGVAVPLTRPLEVQPEPGLNYWVLTASYYSHVQTDTAWVMVDPVSSFEIDRQSVDPGDEVVLTWSAPGADRVTVESAIGDIPVGGGPVSVVIHDDTEFVFSAWYSGRREVIERAVTIRPPQINEFRFSENWVPADNPVTLHWHVEAAETVTVTGPSGSLTGLAPIDSLVVDPPVYGVWMVTAYGPGGWARQHTELRPAYDPVGTVTLNPPVAMPGEFVTVSWDIPGAMIVDVAEFRTFGQPAGEISLLAGTESEYINVSARLADGAWTYHLAPLRVDVDPTHPPTLHISASALEITHDPARVESAAPEDPPRFDVYVVGENLLGPVQAMSFSLVFPEWLEVEKVWPAGGDGYETTSPDFAHQFGWRDPVGAFTGELARFRLKQVGNPSPGTDTTVGILADPAPRWYVCLPNNAFAFQLPAMTVEIGEPMPLTQLRTPVLALPLATEWQPGGLRLSWADLPDVGFESLELWRGLSPDELARLISVGDDKSWIDPEAVSLLIEGPLHYQLVGTAVDGSTWQSTTLRIEEVPAGIIPARTRLVGARPNPFNPRTTIHWELAAPGTVRLAIYDLAGRLVRDWSLPNQSWGPGQIEWDGTDRRGSRTASGVYFVRMQADGLVDTKRVTLLK